MFELRWGPRFDFDTVTMAKSFVVRIRNGQRQRINIFEPIPISGIHALPQNLQRAQIGDRNIQAIGNFSNELLFGQFDWSAEIGDSQQHKTTVISEQEFGREAAANDARKQSA